MNPGWVQAVCLTVATFAGLWLVLARPGWVRKAWLGLAEGLALVAGVTVATIASRRRRGYRRERRERIAAAAARVTPVAPLPALPRRSRNPKAPPRYPDGDHLTGWEQPRWDLITANYDRDIEEPGRRTR